MREVELLRGNKVHQSSHRYFWTWKTKADGQSIWHPSKWQAIEAWVEYARENKVNAYKFVQKLTEQK
jgi:hypothetical protein